MQNFKHHLRSTESESVFEDPWVLYVHTEV